MFCVKLNNRLKALFPSGVLAPPAAAAIWAAASAAANVSAILTPGREEEEKVNKERRHHLPNPARDIVTRQNGTNGQRHRRHLPLANYSIFYSIIPSRLECSP